jgi:hypothetical protein
MSRGKAIAAWHFATHHLVHPISAALVLAAAGVEVFEWVSLGIEHVAHLIPVGS